MEAWPGGPYPLGATYDGAGTNFTLFSEVAEGVELCLFDEDGEETRIPILERDAQVWHIYLPAGRARPAVRLPRARSLRPEERVTGATRASCSSTPTPRPSTARSTGRRPASRTTSTTRSKRNQEDSAPHTMKSVVTNPFFDWQDDRAPRRPYHETVIYEAHVKGLTMTHPDIPEEIRGTYAAISYPAIIDHLTSMGVTAIELMPVHQFVNDSTLIEKGLSNYWGYNTIGFFAPHNAYSSSGQLGRTGPRVQVDGA